MTGNGCRKNLGDPIPILQFSGKKKKFFLKAFSITQSFVLPVSTELGGFWGVLIAQTTAQGQNSGQYVPKWPCIEGALWVKTTLPRTQVL